MEDSILKLPHPCIDTVYLFTKVNTIFRRRKKLQIKNYVVISLIGFKNLDNGIPFHS